MRERLRIGEVAGLVGLTPKTVRHYEKIGLLPPPGRSDSGHRLYAADDLLRLNRIKRLRSLGLSLAQIRSVLGCGEEEATLRKALEALRDDVEGQIERLEERRGRIEGILAREGLESLPSPTFEKAVALFGDRLSGGERQRIALARMLLCDPRLLLLDEVTSQLDAANERALKETVREVSRGRAVVVIAHRLSTVVEADSILLLDGGRISAKGTYEELLKESPLYKELVETQLIEAEGISSRESP